MARGVCGQNTQWQQAAKTSDTMHRDTERKVSGLSLQNRDKLVTSRVLASSEMCLVAESVNDQ